MLGIYGGTFDPVHYGHLRTALEVKEALGLAELRFLPCRFPPHRSQPGASPQQRLLLLETALQHAGLGFTVDGRELRREGPSYMFDTLTSLREELGSDLPICLILGLDAFAGLPSWHRWRELFDLTHLAIMQRPDAPNLVRPGELADHTRGRQTADISTLHASPHGKIAFLEVTQLAISATKIRQIILEGKSARYLLPDPVLEMIQAEGLYR